MQLLVTTAETARTVNDEGNIALTNRKDRP